SLELLTWLAKLPRLDPVVGRGMSRSLRSRSHSGPDLVEVDIDPAGQQGRFVQEFPTLEAALEEPPLATFFPVSPPSNVLAKPVHELRDVRELEPQCFYSPFFGQFEGDLLVGDFLDGLAVGTPY